MKRPVCSICGNKINDNTYLWLEREKQVVHKICLLVTKEYKKNVVVEPATIKIKGKTKGGDRKWQM